MECLRDPEVMSLGDEQIVGLDEVGDGSVDIARLGANHAPRRLGEIDLTERPAGPAQESEAMARQHGVARLASGDGHALRYLGDASRITVQGTA